MSLDAWPRPRPESAAMTPTPAQAPHAVREDLGRAPGAPADRRHAGRALRRPAPRPRGDLAAGLHLAARARPQGAAARAHGGDDGPLDARPRRAAATGASRSSTPQAAAQIGAARDQLPRLRHRAARAGQRGPGHRARHRAGAGSDPAGHDHRLRRQPHQHPRRVRRAGLRHRHQRGRRTCSPRSACCSAARRRWQVHVEGHAAARASPPRTSSWPSSPGSASAAAPGYVIEYRGSAIRALSMEERMTVCNMSIEAGARAGMIAPDDTTFAVPGGPAARAEGRGVGRGGRALAAAADRRRRHVRPRG